MRDKIKSFHEKAGNSIQSMAQSAVTLSAVLKPDNKIFEKTLKHSQQPAKRSSSIFSFLQTVRPKERMVFTRQLSATLGAGLLLTEALEVIAEDMENQYFRGVIAQIVKDIRGGSDFSRSLSRYPKIFGKTYVAIVRSGEATGSLHKTMDNLAKYLEETEKLREKVVTAIRYPLFVLSFAVIVVVVIVLFLIPKFADMFAHAGSELPMLTRIVVGISTFAIHHTWKALLLIVVTAAAYVYSLKFPQVRFFADNLKIRMPIIGKDIFHRLYLSRFCRTFGFLLSGGVNLSTALEITAQVVSNIPMATAIERIRQRVVGGATISGELRKHKVFPPLVCKMSHVGEKTGRLAEMLGRTSDYYDNELDHTLQRLTSLLEPVLIVFIGGIVLIVVLALYLPIFKMSSAIRS